jgi:hypothetical protein
LYNDSSYIRGKIIIGTEKENGTDDCNKWEGT